MKAKFTGHDTFPLRHGWLYKATNLVNNNDLLTTSDVDQAARTISVLGVGKNMVNAIKYWSEACQVIETRTENRSNVQKVSELGNYIFFGRVPGSDRGWEGDPYLEDIGTVWLLHFLLNFEDSHLTAYRYFFNYSNRIYFEKQKLIDDLFEDACQLTGSKAFNKTTVKKDVDCFLATYAQKKRITGKKTGAIDEDYFASPLAELGLVRDLGRGFFQCDLGERPTLPVEVFMYALVRFFNVFNSASRSSQLSFEDIMTKPLSPGRIFKLSEEDLGRLLDESVDYFASNDGFSWVDSLGLKQVSIDHSLLEDPMGILGEYYKRQVR